jgi:hypothetical protein
MKEDTMLFKRTVLALFIALAVAASIFSGCQGGSGNMAITVTDTAGNPLAGAKVTSQEQPAGQLKLTGITSADNNIVSFAGIKPGKYEIQIDRFDYQIQNIELTVKKNLTASATVLLEKG